MNILFITAFEVSPEVGGTERATSSIAKGLKEQYHHTCYSVYLMPIASSFRRYNFEKSFHIAGRGRSFTNELADIIKRHDIDIIINQGCFEVSHDIRKAVEISKRNARVISMLHYYPGSEERLYNLHRLIYNIKKGNNRLRNIKNLLLFPVLRYKKHLENSRFYRYAYNDSEKLVLLSKSFVKRYIDYAKLNGDGKFYCIPNSLSFVSYFDMNDYDQKKQEVLIVARLDEIYKRLSLALKIWSFIEQNPSLREWKLTVVGHGDEYKPYYEKLIRKLNLERVTLEGAQNPEPYYRRASIFLMTSYSEGFALTLLEAQQNACVPIAFNSFGPFPDIIENGISGILVPNNDLKEYVNSLTELMSNYPKRKEMAADAVESSRKFSQESICSEWESLINSLDA